MTWALEKELSRKISENVPSVPVFRPVFQVSCGEGVGHLPVFPEGCATSVELENVPSVPMFLVPTPPPVFAKGIICITNHANL